MLCALILLWLFVYYFGFFGNHYNSSVGTVKSDYITWKHIIIM